MRGLLGARQRLRWTRLATGESDEVGFASNVFNHLIEAGNSRSSLREPATDDDRPRPPRLGPYAFSLPAPGRYRLSFPEIPSIAPFEVDVPEQGFVQFEVERR